MKTLVFLEHHDGAIQKGSLGVLSQAASLGDASGILVGQVRGKRLRRPARTGRRRCTSPTLPS